MSSRNGGLRLVAGACAIGLGLGVVRFDFAAIGREMLSVGWLEPGGIARLGGSNLLGYLLGALHHSRLGDPRQVRRILIWAVVVVVCSLWLEAIRGAVVWQEIWRLLAGWGSGHLMAGAPSIALAGMAGIARRRGTGIVMSGGGIGAIMGAFAVGTLAPAAPATGWLVLASLASLLAVPVIWMLCSVTPELQATPSAPSPTPSPLPTGGSGRRQSLRALTAGYLLLGAAQVPVVLYTPLLVSRRLALSPALSSEFLSILGLGCALGALMAASVPKAYPTRLLLPLASLVGLAGSVCLLFGTSLAVIGLAAFLSGMWVWLIVPFTFDRLQELVAPHLQRRQWAWLTTLLGTGFMAFAFLCAPLAAHHLKAVLVLAVALMVLHVGMEVLQAREA